MACQPGKILNPYTLKCISASGKTAHDLVAQGVISDAYLLPLRKSVRKPRVPAPALALAPCNPGSARNPLTGRCERKTHKKLYAPAERRTSSEGSVALPLGSAAAPLADRFTLQGWLRGNCKNDRDPISGTHFASADTAALQEVVRLHNRTCTMAAPLNAKIAAEHKAGVVATVPGDPHTHLTLADFDALRDVMRRTNPAYKIPARKHQPHPPTWQLYIASDNRSGPEFASVLFIDVTKAIHGPQGVEYPAESVKVDLGFIPLNLGNGACSPQIVVDLLLRLTAAQRLLVPVAGGWKPIAGFPFKKDWTKARWEKLCADLQKAAA